MDKIVEIISTPSFAVHLRSERQLNQFIKMKIHFLLSLLPIVIASIKSEEDAGLSAQPRLLQGIYIEIMS